MCRMLAPGCSRDYGEGKGGDLKLLVHHAPWCLHSEKGQDHTTAMKIMVHQQHSPRAIFSNKKQKKPHQENKNTSHSSDTAPSLCISSSPQAIGASSPLSRHRGFRYSSAPLQLRSKKPGQKYMYAKAVFLVADHDGTSHFFLLWLITGH